MHCKDKDKILEDVEPLLTDISGAFEQAIAKTASTIEADFPNTNDGYLKSALTRGHVKEWLHNNGYTLAPVANTGIEITYDSKYAVKVVRSDHSSNVPAPSTISRASWYAANQPRLSVDGTDSDAFWSIKNLGLRGCDLDEAILRSLGAQHDGLTHLIVDWEEIDQTGTARIALSLPVGVWKRGETPRLAWRYIYEASDAYKGSTFVPSDEDIDIFIDDEGDTRLGVKVG